MSYRENLLKDGTPGATTVIGTNWGYSNGLAAIAAGGPTGYHYRLSASGYISQTVLIYYFSNAQQYLRLRALFQPDPVPTEPAEATLLVMEAELSYADAPKDYYRTPLKYGAGAPSVQDSGTWWYQAETVIPIRTDKILTQVYFKVRSTSASSSAVKVTSMEVSYTLADTNVIDPTKAKLWHFDADLKSTGGLSPTVSDLIDFPVTGLFGSAVCANDLEYNVGAMSEWSIFCYAQSLGDFGMPFECYVIRSDGKKWRSGVATEDDMPFITIESGVLKIRGGEITFYGNYNVDEVLLVNYLASADQVRFWMTLNAPFIDPSESEIRDTDLRADLRLSAPLPTAITMDSTGIRAQVAGAGHENEYAILDYRGLYISEGAVQIDSAAGETYITGDYIDLGNAGIDNTGALGTSVRMWAGSTHANRATAPFRVTQEGKLYATNAEISGTITGSIIQTLEGGKKRGLYVTGTTGDLGLFYNDVELITFYNDLTGYQIYPTPNHYLSLGAAGTYLSLYGDVTIGSAANPATLDLHDCTISDWGSNAPTAIATLGA